MSDTSILGLLVNLRYHLIQYTGGRAAATSPENQKPCLRIILTGTALAQFTLYIWKPPTDGISPYFRVCATCVRGQSRHVICVSVVDGLVKGHGHCPVMCLVREHHPSRLIAWVQKLAKLLVAVQTSLAVVLVLAAAIVEARARPLPFPVACQPVRDSGAHGCPVVGRARVAAQCAEP